MTAAAGYRRHGIELIGPLLTGAPARARPGYARADFAVDYDARTVTCPQGRTPASWSPCTQKDQDKIVATFSRADCGPCPARQLCTGNSGKRRQLTLLPRDLAGILAANRAQEKTVSFRADYARRAGIEGTMRQAVTHGARRARYRGLAKPASSTPSWPSPSTSSGWTPTGPTDPSTGAEPPTSPASPHNRRWSPSRSRRRVNSPGRLGERLSAARRRRDGRQALWATVACARRTAG